MTKADELAMARRIIERLDALDERLRRVEVQVGLEPRTTV